MTEGKQALIQGLLNEYDIETADDIQDALQDLLAGTIQGIPESEMDNHLGYDKYERSPDPNYRNGAKPKTARSKYREFQVDVPQDRNSHLILKLFQSAKKTSPALKIKWFPCTQKE